jgi:hypothetical protein
MTAAEKPKIISAADLMALNLPPQRWVVRDVLPEGLTLLAGKPKIGKSWLTLGLSIAVARGDQALGKLTTEGGDVLCLSLEDNTRRAKSRLETAIPDGVAPLRLHFSCEWPRFGAGGHKELDAWIGEHKAARLVVIDTLAKIRPARRRNGNAYDEDYSAISRIKELADRYRIAIIVVTHVRKMPSDDPFDTLSGTLGLTGAADTVMILSRDRGQHVLHITGRDVEQQELAMAWDAESAAWALVGDAARHRLSGERSVILDAFSNSNSNTSGNTLSIAEIAKATGKEPNPTRQLVHKLCKDGYLENVSYGRYAIVNV